jgi:pimeloyl-ACP methyl ester carboxylesterase
MPTTRVSGVSIAYDVRGSGPTALFIMGLGGRATDWNDAFIRRLTPRLEVVTFDNRGTGGSDRPDEGYTLDVMADEAVGTLDALDRPRAHVIGISMGGRIAQLVALRHPSCVARLVLIATHGGGRTVVPPTPEVMTALTLDRSRPTAEIIRSSMSAIAAPGLAHRDPAAVDALIALAEAQPTPPMTFARQMTAILASNRMERLGTIAAPTLVVHGSEDPLVPPANGAAIARVIPGARLLELPGCGHLPMWECPRRLADELLHFLDAAG